jgi:hypothetical protein
LSVIQEILRESIGRLWMPHFKNEWSDCKNALMQIVNILSHVYVEMFSSFF